MTSMLQRRRGRPSRDRLAEAADVIARGTAAFPDGSLRVDWKRLDDPEAGELVALVERCASGIGFDTSKLAKKAAARFERLLETACARDEGWFEQQRQDTKLRRDVDALIVKSRLPPRRPRYEELGAIVLPKLWTFTWFEGEPILFLQHIALLVAVLAQLENGRSLAPQSRIEGDGDTSELVVDAKFGPVPISIDPESNCTARWTEDAKHLAANHLLTFDRQGTEIRLGRGSRVLALTKART